MILLSAQNISKTYMERRILDNASFFLNEGDKVGIIGINGTGKSTLLKILAGAEEPDSGEIIRTKGVRISYLPQIPEFEEHGNVLEQVMLHLSSDLKQAKEFEAKSILGKLGIADFTKDISSLSGGERRRVGIAVALIQPSDILLMDEPTNHIDNETVQLLEEQMKKYRGAIVMVTHDRYFLDKMSVEIWEITGSGTVSRYNGNYSDYSAKVLQNADTPEKPEKQSEKKERTFVGKKKLKFSFKEQREFETIDDDIAGLEQQIADTEKQIAECSFDYVKLQELSDRKEELENQLAEKMDRWVYLNDLAERIENGEMI